MSFLNVTDAATGELKNILVRLRELSTQSSNGVLSDTQRASLNKEAQALQAEYNRVVETATFNGVNVFGGSLSVQAGFGGAVLEVGLQRTTFVGDGTFQTSRSFFTGPNYAWIVTAADVNGDGLPDILTVDATGASTDKVVVLLGNGDGTFQARRSFAAGTSPLSMTVADVNGDGVQDIVAGNLSGNTVSVLIGNGNGTFQAKSSFATGGAVRSVVAGDIDRDGTIDLLTADSAGTMSVLSGNGDGTFRARQLFSLEVNTYAGVTGDVNGDGLLDFIAVDQLNNMASVLLGNGNGTFQARKSFNVAAGGSYPMSVVAADVDGNGVIDLITANGGANSTAGVLLGNGDGTFKAKQVFTVGSFTLAVSAADVNGDGVLDLLTADSGPEVVSVLLGNGDGTFKARASFAGGSNLSSVATADVNGDGVLDVLTANANSHTVGVLLGNGEWRSTSMVSMLSEINVATRDQALAAQGRIDSYLDEVNLVSGAIGVGLSRLAVASANLRTTVEANKAAVSRITDVDVAEESARLVSTEILQQAAIAVLSHASRGPELALQLLQG